MIELLTLSKSVTASILVATGIIMIIAEMVLPSFLFLGFAIGAFTAAFVVAVFSPSFELILVAFALSSLGGFCVLRYVFRQRGDAHGDGEDVNRF
jgi:membrane protein implicated in regulation of membrane protease activity